MRLAPMPAPRRSRPLGASPAITAKSENPHQHLKVERDDVEMRRAVIVGVHPHADGTKAVQKSACEPINYHSAIVALTGVRVKDETGGCTRKPFSARETGFDFSGLGFGPKIRRGNCGAALLDWRLKSDPFTPPNLAPPPWTAARDFVIPRLTGQVLRPAPG